MSVFYVRSLPSLRPVGGRWDAAARRPRPDDQRPVLRGDEGGDAQPGPTHRQRLLRRQDQHQVGSEPSNQ